MNFMVQGIRLVCLLAAGQAMTWAVDVSAFIGARILDGTSKAPIEDGVIVVRDGRVEAVGSRKAIRIPEEARIIDLKGKTITPGFHSTHVHISDVNGVSPPAYTKENTERQLRVYARYGITTLWSLGGEQRPAFEARREQEKQHVDRSRLYLSGEIITGETVEAARETVARVAATKPDILKIRVDDQLGTTKKMPPAVYKAVIEEAHRRGLRVSAHIFYLEDAKELLRSGVDMIAHSVRDREIDDEFISLMKARNIPYCPTLTREVSTFVYGSTPAFFNDPFFLREADRQVVEQLKEPARQQALRESHSSQAYKKALEVARRNLAKAAQAGVLIVMGTDSGASANRFQGYFEHMEMEMMAEAGLAPQQILRSATQDAARAMKLDNAGVIAKGAWADFNVFDRDPSSDIRLTKTLQSVWISGREVSRPSGK
ncbi:MAG TPA: amidohydrolase family protein [Bryobacteraceae bacterium]|nr:amidohydrolase family protein [Bryobacteraceae bacterium]